MEKKLHTISFQEASFGYKNKELISKVNLELTQGELIGLVGLNGTGKTTFLKSILKEIPVLSGNILIDGVAVQELNIQDYVSVVFTDRIRVFGFTVYDLIATAKAKKVTWNGKLKQQEQDIVNKYIELLDLTHLADRQINELSDGQFQKVMIARALAQETPIVLLDEPTAFLDIPNKKMLFSLLQNIVKHEQKTIIVSTHNEHFIYNIAHNVLVLSNGNMHKVKPSNFTLENL